ncbi:MAG: thymidylate kinase [Acidobacteria bacterium]|jgi:thymidylate kinase|nr:MAG: thymidylate kinase [Acidobacteriota bacterium]
MSSTTRPVLVSFSGIDGAGKSTQIERLHAQLTRAGLRVSRLAFWDNIVVLPRFRAGVSHKVLGGELGIGSPEKPVARYDKNARKWYLMLARSPLYFFDVMSLRKVVNTALSSDSDVIIFDRYIYDQIAVVPGHPLGRAYVRFLLGLAPRPDLAYVLDADPEAAMKRKPEYPLEFLRRYRESYLALQPLAPEMVVIPALDVEGVQRAIVEEFRKRFAVFSSETLRDVQRISA